MQITAFPYRKAVIAGLYYILQYPHAPSLASDTGIIAVLFNSAGSNTFHDETL